MTKIAHALIALIVAPIAMIGFAVYGLFLTFQFIFSDDEQM